MKKTFDSDIWGTVETRRASVAYTPGRITLAQARAMAELTEYGTDEDGFKYVAAGVPVGPWGDVLEAEDVASVEALADFYDRNEIATSRPTITGDAIEFDPYA